MLNRLGPFWPWSLFNKVVDSQFNRACAVEQTGPFVHFLKSLFNTSSLFNNVVLCTFVLLTVHMFWGVEQTRPFRAAVVSTGSGLGPVGHPAGHV